MSGFGDITALSNLLQETDNAERQDDDAAQQARQFCPAAVAAPQAQEGGQVKGGGKAQQPEKVKEEDNGDIWSNDEIPSEEVGFDPRFFLLSVRKNTQVLNSHNHARGRLQLMNASSTTPAPAPPPAGFEAVQCQQRRGCNLAENSQARDLLFSVRRLVRCVPWFIRQDPRFSGLQSMYSQGVFPLSQAKRHRLGCNEEYPNGRF